MSKFPLAVMRLLIPGVLLAIASFASGQQDYPNKPIRFITPYPPGGSTTTVLHLVGQRMTEKWGQPVIVDNRGGGNTVIGTEALAKSPPDGYTIMLTANSHVIIPHLYSTLPFDVIRDFAAVTPAYNSEYVLVVHPSVPANNLQEFIALAKSKPGQLNYASPGNGSPNQLATENFNMMVGARMQHIPYKGSGPAIADLIGGRVQLYFTSPLPAIPHIRTGKLKAIALTGEARSPALPQVPTFTEAGLPGLDARVWFGVLAPAGTPKAIIDQLAAEIGRIMVMPDTKEKLLAQGLEPFVSTPEQFAALMKADLAKFARVIKAANIKLDQ